jgi:hypothetical protein
MPCRRKSACTAFRLPLTFVACSAAGSGSLRDRIRDFVSAWTTVQFFAHRYQLSMGCLTAFWAALVVDPAAMR